MEIQLDGTNVMHHDLQTEMYGHVIPSLQHVSIGVCSDTCDPEETVANSENGDTDYDINEENESEDEDVEEEEDDDESSEDDSQIHDLIDDLEVKFRKLAFTKISEAEEFFDDANTLKRTCLLHSMMVEPQSDVCTVKNTNHSLTTDNAERDLSEKNDNVGKEGKTHCFENSTQTDEDIFVTKSSGTLVSNENMCNREDGLEPEQARVEISQLRDVRDSLVAQRQQWEAQRKQMDGKSEELKRTECKVYEIEEAIEAVETAIEFKNEIVVGQQIRKSIADDDNLDCNEIQLVTRLESLSIEELRRLLCVYFAKVVELRYSSRKLEKNVEHIESLNEHLNRRLAREHKHSREMDEEYQTRIRLILTSNNPNSAAYSWYRRMDDQLAAARKKQHDLERSLTALLVRHGYLVNGADYDVRQVVKMLGIEGQLGGTNSRTARGEVSSAMGMREHSSTHHSRATWHKGGKGRLGSRRNGRQLDGHELLRIHRDRDARMAEGWEREHRHAAQPQTSEVRREKRRIIIQPSSGAPSSSNYVHAGPSSHSNHHSHPVSHGTNHHGYK